jgi:hypothetical protein
MEFEDFGHTTTIQYVIGFLKLFGGWEIQRTFQLAITRKIPIFFS